MGEIQMKITTIITLLVLSLFTLTACSSTPKFVPKIINHTEYSETSVTWQELIDTGKVDLNVQKVISDFKLPKDSRYCQENADCKEGLICITLCKNLMEDKIGGCPIETARALPKFAMALSDNGVCFNESENYEEQE
jgi:hypothetical protein